MNIFKELWFERHSENYWDDEFNKYPKTKNKNSIDIFYLYFPENIGDYNTNFQAGWMRRAKMIHKIIQYWDRIYFIDINMVSPVAILFRHIEPYQFIGIEKLVGYKYRENRKVASLIEKMISLYEKKYIKFQTILSFLKKLEIRYPLDEHIKNRWLKKYHKYLKEYTNKWDDEWWFEYFYLDKYRTDFEESNKQRKRIIKS